MMKELITTSEYTKDSILAEDILDSNGDILVAAGTKLNEYIITRLSSCNIRKVKVIINSYSIEDKELWKQFKKSYYNYVYIIKNVFQDISNGLPIDYKSILTISKDISSYKKHGYRILRYLQLMQCIDEYTYYHSVNVAFYSMLIARWYKLSDKRTEQAIISGLLHDLGKMKIPEDILNKKGILTEEEYEIIKKHTIHGYEMVRNIEGLDDDIKTAILYHHERMDGSGYPYQKENSDLNLYSKIVAVADVYDAMTSNRVYKKGTTPFEVFEMFQTVGLSLFDINIMNLLKRKIAAYLVGLYVSLSTGEIGEIVYIPLSNITCPVIKLTSGYIDLSNNKNINILSFI